jgi:hypothetical protein
MHESFNIASPSPNTQHTAHFLFSGEIRFGPPYFSLSVDDYSFGQRIFGDAHLWSPSSNLLAVQEWLTIDYSEGPITALLLIDLDLGREASVARATKGFIVPEAFEGPMIVYRKEYGGQTVVQHFDLDTTKIEGWKELA